MRRPPAPASATVTTLNGLALVPAPPTADWLTGVNGVVVPSDDVVVDSCAAKFGANSVPAANTNVPQSPGLTVDGNSSKRSSPAWVTWQLSSSPSVTLVSGPLEAMSLKGTAAPAGAAVPHAASSSTIGRRAVQARRRVMAASLRR